MSKLYTCSKDTKLGTIKISFYCDKYGGRSYFVAETDKMTICYCYLNYYQNYDKDCVEYTINFYNYDKFEYLSEIGNIIRHYSNKHTAPYEYIWMFTNNNEINTQLVGYGETIKSHEEIEKDSYLDPPELVKESTKRKKFNPK